MRLFARSTDSHSMIWMARGETVQAIDGDRVGDPFEDRRQDQNRSIEALSPDLIFGTRQK